MPINMCILCTHFITMNKKFTTLALLGTMSFRGFPSLSTLHLELVVLAIKYGCSAYVIEIIYSLLVSTERKVRRIFIFKIRPRVIYPHKQ